MDQESRRDFLEYHGLRSTRLYREDSPAISAETPSTRERLTGLGRPRNPFAEQGDRAKGQLPVGELDADPAAGLVFVAPPPPTYSTMVHDEIYPAHSRCRSWRSHSSIYEGLEAQELSKSFEPWRLGE